MYARRVSGTVNRSAWLIRPRFTSFQRASPGRIGRPAASADVHPAGRSLFERRLQIAPEPAVHLSPPSCGYAA